LKSEKKTINRRRYWNVGVNSETLFHRTCKILVTSFGYCTGVATFQELIVERQINFALTIKKNHENLIGWVVPSFQIALKLNIFKGPLKRLRFWLILQV
jgi:hypothetical protein